MDFELARMTLSTQPLGNGKILLLGDQVRQALHSAGMVKDRKYHFRTYKSCIVGKDMVEWLVKNKHCQSREQAVHGLRVLQQHSVLHHVCDDHEVKDEMLFYRFRRDDASYRDDRELSLFYKAQELHNGLASRTTGILKNYQQKGELYRNAFLGSEFVDYLLTEGEAYCREEAVLIGRKLLENDTIRHVQDDHHFRDDNRLLYQFTLDFSRHRYLYEVFDYSRSRRNSCRLSGDISHRTQTTSSSSSSLSLTPPTSVGLQNLTPETSRREVRIPATDDRSNSISVEDSSSIDQASESITSTPSVLIRHASVEELESPDTPYVKQLIKVTSDAVGFGFVIRGESPTYVQAVDPMGPAATAGIKVRQYIYSVNGQYVLHNDHKTVGQLITRSGSHCNLVIMTHKRDAFLSSSH